MAKIVKIGQVLLDCWTQSEVDRLPNKNLGRNCRIHTNKILQDNKRLSQYINDRTMGVLDNYAQHVNMHISITPLENDLFDDITVRASKGNNNVRFPLKIDDKEGLRGFLKELYTKIHESFNPSKESPFATIVNKSKTEKTFEEAKLYAINIKDRIHNFKVDKIRSFVEKHENGNIFMKALSEAIEYRYYDELYR